MTSSINVIMRWKKMFRCEARLRAVFLLLENPWKRTQNKLAYERKCKRDMRMTKLRAASSTSVGRRAKRETVTFLMLIDIHLERCIDLVSADSRPIYRPIVDRLLSVTSVKYLTMDWMSTMTECRSTIDWYSVSCRRGIGEVIMVIEQSGVQFNLLSYL